MDEIGLKNKEARIYPGDWEFVLKSRDWTEEEKDSILALLVVEIAHMYKFTKGYTPIWKAENLKAVI